MGDTRRQLKRQLARIGGSSAARGATLLTYHRIGGDSNDELDTPAEAFDAHLDALSGHHVVSLDAALDRLDAGDERPCVVLTFDDGFADVHATAWPRLRERGMPFTVYVAAGLVGGGAMTWEGATARSSGVSMTWDQLADLAASDLCTVGNHTWSHARPEALDAAELDRCSDELERRLGRRPRHFAYTWGIEVPAMREALGERFRSAASGLVGRNLPGTDRLVLRRVPVRRSDPPAFYRAKLTGELRAERAYDVIVRVAKRVGVRG